MGLKNQNKPEARIPASEVEAPTFNIASCSVLAAFAFERAKSVAKPLVMLLGREPVIGLVLWNKILAPETVRARKPQNKNGGGEDIEQRQTRVDENMAVAHKSAAAAITDKSYIYPSSNDTLSSVWRRADGSYQNLPQSDRDAKVIVERGIPLSTMSSSDAMSHECTEDRGAYPRECVPMEHISTADTKARGNVAGGLDFGKARGRNETEPFTAFFDCFCLSCRGHDVHEALGGHHNTQCLYYTCAPPNDMTSCNSTDRETRVDTTMDRDNKAPVLEIACRFESSQSEAVPIGASELTSNSIFLSEFSDSSYHAQKDNSGNPIVQIAQRLAIRSEILQEKLARLNTWQNPTGPHKAKTSWLEHNQELAGSTKDILEVGEHVFTEIIGNPEDLRAWWKTRALEQKQTTPRDTESMQPTPHSFLQQSEAGREWPPPAYLPQPEPATSFIPKPNLSPRRHQGPESAPPRLPVPPEGQVSDCSQPDIFERAEFEITPESQVGYSLPDIFEVAEFEIGLTTTPDDIQCGHFSQDEDPFVDKPGQDCEGQYAREEQWKAEDADAGIQRGIEYRGRANSQKSPKVRQPTSPESGERVRTKLERLTNWDGAMQPQVKGHAADNVWSSMQQASVRISRRKESRFAELFKSMQREARSRERLLSSGNFTDSLNS